MSGSDEKGEDRLEVLTGAYVLVAAADGVIAPSEVARFRETIAEIARMLNLDLSGLERLLESTLGLFRARPGRSRDDALARIAAYREDAAMRDAIRRLARIAAVADRELEPQEEYALREIADMLGMKAEDI